MAHSHDVHHDYHLVNPSPWPVVGSISALILAIGAVVAMKGLALPSDAAGFGAQFGNAVLLKGKMWLLGLGALGVALTMFGWWGDMIKESRQGDHTPVVDIGMRYGMILFIASEVMFFVGWFWAFFDFSLFPNALVKSVGGQWPPKD